MSTPRSRAASIDSGIAGAPSTAIVPADPTVGAAPSRRRSSARRSSPSSIGERQMFPLHTTRIAAIGRARSLAVALSRPIAARPPRGRCRRRAGSPARDRAGRPRSRRARRVVHSSHRYTATASPKTSWSSSQVVAGPSPDRFALVVASGPAPSTARASRWSGIRMPIDAGSPPRSQSRLRGARGTTIVSAPGHRAAARRSARSSSCATARASATEARRIGNVRPDGRCFASNTRAVAAGSSGRAAIPYTVSVGKTTSSPRRVAATASATGSPLTAVVPIPRALGR